MHSQIYLLITEGTVLNNIGVLGQLRKRFLAHDDNTAGRMLALQAVDPGSIPRIPSGVIPECKTRIKS